MGSLKNSIMDLCHHLSWKWHNGRCMKIHLYLQATHYLSKYQKKISIIFRKFAPELKKPLPAKMCFPNFFLQKCIFTKNAVLQHKYKFWFEEIFACSQFFPQKCFFIDYQASRSPLTCKQVRGGTSLVQMRLPQALVLLKVLDGFDLVCIRPSTSFNSLSSVFA